MVEEMNGFMRKVDGLGDHDYGQTFKIVFIDEDAIDVFDGETGASGWSTLSMYTVPKKYLDWVEHEGRALQLYRQIDNLKIEEESVVIYFEDSTMNSCYPVSQDGSRTETTIPDLEIVEVPLSINYSD